MEYRHEQYIDFFWKRSNPIKVKTDANWTDLTAFKT